MHLGRTAEKHYFNVLCKYFNWPTYVCPFTLRAGMCEIVRFEMAHSS